MAIDKLIPQYLNSDTDQKLVKSVEMTDNLNIRVSSDDEGTDGVVKNIKGNTVVAAATTADDFFTGDNRVIGSVANEEGKEIIFVAWNSNSRHSIYRLDMTTNKFKLLYRDPVLNFQKFSHVECSFAITEEKETLFYFTDNINPPMKVNVNRLLLGTYPASLTSGTDAEKLLNLTVAKQPPLKAPSFNIVNNPDLTGSSRIKDNNYQFAYKYIYTDGEHSALSPYSSLSVANSQLVDGFNTDNAKDFFNQINVFGEPSVADVDKIVFYARRVGGQFFEIEEVDNSSALSTIKVEFTDNVIGTFLSKDEENKIFDNVPQRARAQAIVGNRLMYGNYVEGYENTNTIVEVLDNYHKNPSFQEIDVTIQSMTQTGSNRGLREIHIDYSSVTSPSSDSKILLNFFIDFETIHAVGLGTVGYILLDDFKVNYAFNNSDGNREFEQKTFVLLQGKSLLDTFTNKLSSSFGTSNFSFEPAISFSTEGVHVKEIIEVSAGTSVAGIRNLVQTRLASKTFRMFLNPTDDDRRFSGLSDNPNSAVNLLTDLFAQHSVSFKGQMNMTFVHNGTSGANIDKYVLRPKTNGVKLTVAEFNHSNGVRAEVVTSDTVTLNWGQFAFLDASLTEGSCVLATNLIGDRSFKSGASHRFGIVYYDDRGRSCGVQEIGDVDIKHLNNRANENNLDGKSSVVLRLKHEPPSFASRWSPVYTGKGDIDLKFQYGVKGAFIPTNNIDRTSTFSSDENIFVSINSLFNKESSYTKSSSALIEYTYEQGDKLRIIKHGSTNLRTTEEFEIVDYRTLVDDKSNPILDKTSVRAIQATTGDFLVVKNNNDAASFNYNAVLNNTSAWFNRCIVEVYRPSKKVEDEIYYEVGKSYGITSGAHDDERTSTTVAVTIETGDDATATDVQFHTDVEVFKGDILSRTSDGGVVITVGNVYESDVVSGKFIVNGTATGTVTAVNFTVTNPEKVINLSIGDVYHRARNCFVYNEQFSANFTNSSSNNSVVEFIEDYSVSDFFKSERSSIGRPFVYIPDEDSIRRTASITYSDIYLPDSDRLGLSSFNLSLANFKDLQLIDGGIQSMINRNEALTVLQKMKALQIPVNRNLIEFSSGDANISVAKNVLGLESYYAGNFGTKNPESVVERFGVVYFVDSSAGKALRLAGDGITPISDKDTSSFFEETFKTLLTVTENIRVVGGFDPDNDEYLITVEPVHNRTITISSEIGSIPTDAAGAFTVRGITYVNSPVLWSMWGTDWDDFCMDWDDLGNGVVFLDSAFQAQSILVDSVFAGSTSTINILATDATFSFTAKATLNLSTGVITLESTTCQGTSISLGSTVEAAAGFTISYKHKRGVWGSKYSFQPTCYVNINNDLYSFFDNSSGTMWKHNSNNTRNNFYGVQYTSIIEVVSNVNPSMIKVFEALAVEGNGTWSATLTTSDQSTTIGTTDFDEREGHRYAMIFRDTLKSTSHKIYLGKVSSVSTDKIVFTSPINKIAFSQGDEIKTASGSTLTATGNIISAVSERNTIQCNATVSNVSTNNDIFVEKTARIEGDPMRDVFIKIRLSSSTTTAFEVHAISLSYDRSRLHNDRVN